MRQYIYAQYHITGIHLIRSEDSSQRETQNIKFSPSWLLINLIYLPQGVCIFMKLVPHKISERFG